MKTSDNYDIPVGTKAFILSKLYYGVLSKSLEQLEVDRYYAILHFIHGNHGCTQKHICNALAIDKTAMVKIIEYLIQAGLIERSKNPSDRREHFITLTKKGQKQTVEVIKAFSRIDEEMFAHVSTEEKHIFSEVLQRISSHLKELPANELLFNYTRTAQPKHRSKKIKENNPHNETT